MSTDWLSAVLVAHAASTWAMAGLIWFVQLVHYPLMSRLGRDQWPGYERAHQARTTWIVAPLMLAELATAVALLALTDDPLPRAGAALLVVLWVSTFAVQVPLHLRLARGFDPAVHRALVGSNWLRTLCWTARGIVAAVLLL